MRGKEYISPITATWWLKKRPYTLFMVRELTAVFVGVYALLLLVMLYRASQGPIEFALFVEGLKSPLSIVLHIAVLIMAMYHSITFFNLSGAVMRIWRGEERVPGVMIVAPNYVAWIAVSVVVAWIAIKVSKG